MPSPRKTRYYSRCRSNGPHGLSREVPANSWREFPGLIRGSLGHIFYLLALGRGVPMFHFQDHVWPRLNQTHAAWQQELKTPGDSSPSHLRQIPSVIFLNTLFSRRCRSAPFPVHFVAEIYPL